MKSTFISLILILAGDIIFGQSYDHTFTKHTSIRTPIQNDSEIPGLISTQKTEVVKYYDGIGRLQQEIMVQFTPNQKDMVKPVEYNRYGFNNRSFLPYAAENDDGTYKSDVLSEQHIFFLTASLGLAPY